MNLPAEEERNLLILVGVAAVASAILIFWFSNSAPFAAGFSATVLALAALVIFARKLFPTAAGIEQDMDWSLIRDAVDGDNTAVAITVRTGRLVCANALHEAWFGGAVAPPAITSDTSQVALLTNGAKNA